MIHIVTIHHQVIIHHIPIAKLVLGVANHLVVHTTHIWEKCLIAIALILPHQLENIVLCNVVVRQEKALVLVADNFEIINRLYINSY